MVSRLRDVADERRVHIHLTREGRALKELAGAIPSHILGASGCALPEVLRLLKEQGADDVLVFAGGIIPDDDIPALKAAGIREVFQPGTSTDDIVAFIRTAVHD